MLTQDTAQFSRSITVGSGRANPACFTGRRVIPCSGTPSPRPSNRAGTKVSQIDFSTGTKASPMPRLTRCTNYHSCWSDLCSPEYVDCGCLRETPASVSTDSVHPMTFPYSHLFSTSISPMNPPRNWCPVTTLIPIPRKYSSVWATLCGATTKILLVVSE